MEVLHDRSFQAYASARYKPTGCPAFGAHLPALLRDHRDVFVRRGAENSPEQRFDQLSAGGYQYESVAGDRRGSQPADHESNQPVPAGLGRTDERSSRLHG